MLIASFSGLAALISFHAGVRWYFREWYAPTLVPLLAVCCGFVLVRFAEQKLFLAALAGAGILWTLSGIAVVQQRVSHAPYEIQGDMHAAAQWINENSDPDASVGGFNSGIIGYFSGRETINLDGVVDGYALAALKDRHLTTYLDERCVTHVADFRFYLYWYAEFWDGGIIPELNELVAFDDAIDAQPAPIASPFTVWQYKPKGTCASTLQAK